jgi:histidine ammonia-lyase
VHRCNGSIFTIFGIYLYWKKPMHPADIKTTQRAVRFDQGRLQIEDIADIAKGKAKAMLSEDPQFRAAIARGADFLDRLLREDGIIYGVTTGYGDSCTVTVPPELIADLPHHLYTYHGCGLGEYLTPEQTRAVMATRLASLSKGYSGVSVELLEQIARLLDAGLLPLIPSEGSVGASGDLTPLSYLAAVLCGEREVWRDGAQVPAALALQEAGIKPIRLRPKEGLAIMNGTAVMTALACLAYDRAAYLTQLTTRITAMASYALDGNAHHFDETLFSVKPHAGMQQVAAWLRQDLDCGEQTERNGKRLQDRYSIRCAPHVIGVLADALPFFRLSIENELNSANDNPIIDAEGERVLHGGHFYGGHIAFAMDGMKNAVANLADLLDRQMALLVDSRYNNGLPSNLSGAQGSRAAINHGLKALQISSSAWTAEALKLTMPASVFSRSTECHNQDKVSMGTIAARDCLRVLELTEQVVAALLITVRQGVELRHRMQLDAPLHDRLEQMTQLLSADIAIIEEDRRLEPELRVLLQRMRDQAWDLYA